MWQELVGTLVIQLLGAAFTYGIMWQKVRTLEREMAEARKDIRKLYGHNSPTRP